MKKSDGMESLAESRFEGDSNHYLKSQDLRNPYKKPVNIKKLNLGPLTQGSFRGMSTPRDEAEHL